MRNVIRVIASLVLVAAYAYCGDAAAPLSVQETMGALFYGQMEGRPWHLYAAANSDARPGVYRVLDDPRLAEYHPAAWHILGYIGDAMTVERVEQRLHSWRGVLSRSQKDEALAMFLSLGLLARRDIKAAQELASKMAEPAYWSEIAFLWAEESQATNSLSFVESSLAALSDGYAVAGRQDIKARSRRLSVLCRRVRERTRRSVVPTPIA